MVTAVAAWVDDWYAAVALAEHEDGAGQQLIIQRALDEDGNAAESETYAISTDQGATHYGGILNWSTRSTILYMTLADEAANILSMTTSLRFALPSAEEASLIRRGLAWMMNPQPPKPPEIFSRPLLG